MDEATSQSEFQKWLAASVGDIPDSNSAAIPTKWFRIGKLHHDNEVIEAVDLWQLNPEQGATVRSGIGTYLVEARGMEFDGHRRVGAVRIYIEGAAPVVGPRAGEILCDSWGIAVGDITGWFDRADAPSISKFSDTLIGRYANAAEIVEWEIGEQKAILAIAFTGLGSGAYPVRLIRDGQKTVGLQVEFIEEGYLFNLPLEQVSYINPAVWLFQKLVGLFTRRD